MKKKPTSTWKDQLIPWRKMLIIMKFLGVILLGVCMSVHADVLSQQMKVTLERKQAALNEVLLELSTQTECDFLYSYQLIKNLKVDINAKDKELVKVLDELLPALGLDFFYDNNVIIIREKTGKVPQQQEYRIKGKVLDNNKAGLPGVTVRLEGTTIGTVTGKDGSFQMNLPIDKGTLIFSFIGYKLKQLPFETGKDLVVTLEEEISDLDEVVVTGYNVIRKGDYTGAVTVINAEDILIAGESSIDQMLQGVDPSMAVRNTTGKVGGTPRIRIRGTSTIMGNQEPLWVVDGVVQSDPLPLNDVSTPLYSEMQNMTETAANVISWLNPADIETITILKDASATAIYGSQASNGVIVITTKKAKEPGLNISYSGNFTVGQKPGYHLYDLMNSQELMRFAQEVYEDRDSYKFDILPVGYGGLIKRLHAKEISLEDFQREFRIMENQNTDWFDLLFRNAFSQTHNMSVSGMGEKIASRFSLGINQQRGEAKGNDLMSLTASSNNTFRIDDRLILDLQLNGSYRTTDDFAFGVSPYDYAMNTARTIPMYTENGNYYYHEKNGSSSYSIPGKSQYLYNIQNEIDNTAAENATTTVNATLGVTLKLLKELEFHGQASYSLSSSSSKAYATEFSNYVTLIRRYEYGEVLPGSDEQNATALPFGGVLITKNITNNNYSVRGSLIYNKTFKDFHRVMLQIGVEATSATSKGDEATRYGYLHHRGEKFAMVPKTFVDISGAVTSREDLHEKMRLSNMITNTKSNKLSEYFTAVYNYKERYTLNFSARLDASNRFGQDQNKKFNPSWSLGAKWRVGNEAFMSWSRSWLDMFDLSASYGFRGNAVESVSPYMIATDGGFNGMYQQYTLALKSLSYPNLGWERTNDWNLSLDFSFFTGRLGAVAHVYNSTSKVLSSRDVPIENGVNNAPIEGTKMNKKGYEFTVSVVPVRTKDITWSLSFNAGKIRDKIENNERINTRDDYLNGTALLEGTAYSTFYAYAYDGLHAETGVPTFKNMDIDATENDLDYLVKVGCLEPNVSGGLTTSLRYKNLSLNASFAVSFGAQAFLPAIYPEHGAPTPEKNAPRYLFDRWRKTGDEAHTNIPAIPPGNPNTVNIYLPTTNRVWISPYTMYNKSDLRVADTDFIRCRQMALRYDLPAELSNKLYFKRIALSASMTNPFIIVFDKAWEGRDPETGGWPARRTMSLSLSATF